MFLYAARAATFTLVISTLLTGPPARAQISNLCQTDSADPPETTCSLKNDANTSPTLARFHFSVPPDSQYISTFLPHGRPITPQEANQFGNPTFIDPATHSIREVSSIVNGIVLTFDPDAGKVIKGGCQTINGQTFCTQDSPPLMASWSTGSSDGSIIGPFANNGSVQAKSAFSYALKNTDTVFVGNDWITNNGPGDESVVFKYHLGGEQYSSPEQADRLNKLALGFTVVGLAAAVLLAPPVAGALALSAGAIAGATNVGILCGVGAIATGLAGLHDPPDLNYTAVAVPAPPSINLSGLGPAAQQLVQTEEQIIGLANAISTTTNRITGASLDGDPASQQMQMSALTGFEDQLNATAALLPAQFAAFGQELAPGGFDPTIVSQAQLQALQQSISANGLPNSWVSILNNLGIDQATQSEIVQLLLNADPAQAESVLQNLFKIGPLTPPALSPDSNLQQFAAVLPASRSVTIGTAATAFATIINAGSNPAKSCVIAPNGMLPIDFSYQTTDPATNALTGTPNTPVDIPASASQSFVISVTPTTSLIPVNADFGFFCANANSAPTIIGLDTLLLSASATPVPDIVALAASGDPGIVDVPGVTGTGAFAVATVNVGSSGTITATANTGSATLPVSLKICQTNPQTGVCLATPAASVTTTINDNETPTFGIFVTGNDNVPFSPAVNRVFVQFADSGGTVRGATSVAVRTR